MHFHDILSLLYCVVTCILYILCIIPLSLSLSEPSQPKKKENPPPENIYIFHMKIIAILYFLSNLLNKKEEAASSFHKKRMEFLFL